MEDEKNDRERKEKAANYPWAEIVGDFEMTEEEEQDAAKTLLRLITEFGESENQK